MCFRPHFNGCYGNVGSILYILLSDLITSALAHLQQVCDRSIEGADSA